MTKEPKLAKLLANNITTEVLLHCRESDPDEVLRAVANHLVRRAVEIERIRLGGPEAA